MIEDEIPIAGPIRLTPGRRHLVALVGPTGVGKTTTIAKLAANYPAARKAPRRPDHGRHLSHRGRRAIAHLCRHHRPADGNRGHAARNAPGRGPHGRSGFDSDGHGRPQPARRSEDSRAQVDAGRSRARRGAPGAQSSVASAGSLAKTAEQFAAVGTTALVLTKLDEADVAGQPVAAGAQQPAAAELRDARTERARRHRAGRTGAAGPRRPGNGVDAAANSRTISVP